MAKGAFEVGLRLDLRGLREFEQFADQFPFAISHATNHVAKGPAVKTLRAALPDYFTLRNKWTAGGIRFFKAATKKDLEARVGAISDYLRAQVAGGPRPQGHKPIGAVPVLARADKTTILNRRPDWPMQLIRRGLAYRPGIDGVDTRFGAPKRSKRDRTPPPPLEKGQPIVSAAKHPAGKGHTLWYIGQDSETRIKPTFPVGEITSKVFAKDFPGALSKSIRYAIRTRKVPAS